MREHQNESLSQDIYSTEETYDSDETIDSDETFDPATEVKKKQSTHKKLYILKLN